MKRKTLGIAVAIALGTLSASAFAITPFGNNSNKGALLIYSRIDVAGTNDTLVTMTNDSTNAVAVKCYYASSDPIDTPNTSTAGQLRNKKHFLDFGFTLTHNQPVSWWAKSGQAVGNSQKWAGQVVPPFGTFPDGQTRTAGELKCWAVTDDGLNELLHNHLFGTASIWEAGGQASEYTAHAFQAQGPSTATGTALGSPGFLNLDNVEYDGCPNILLGNFRPTGAAGVRPQTQVTLASCNQDLRQAYTPTITKLTWTFWNQDESPRTNTHFCADSWYETSFPVGNAWFQSSYLSLGTEAAYFRIETTADTQVCGPSTTTSAYVGVMSEREAAGNFVRGTNLVGRGFAPGVIKYDVGIPDSFKR